MDRLKYFRNGVNVDNYIGSGTLKKLLVDLNVAKKSVKVVSPYVSSSLVKRLLYLSEKGISVALVTTDDVIRYKGEAHSSIKKR